MNKKRISMIFLVIGMSALVIGMIIDNTIFSYAAIVFVFLSLILGGRWMRPRKNNRKL